MDAVTTGGGNRTRQPGAARLGHHILGQRLQRARQGAVRGAREGEETRLILLLCVIFSIGRSIATLPSKDKKPSSMGLGERGFHARGVYATLDTSRMGTAKVE